MVAKPGGDVQNAANKSVLGMPVGSRSLTALAVDA
jgi:hypothetical protein